MNSPVSDFEDDDSDSAPLIRILANWSELYDYVFTSFRRSKN